VPIEKRYYILYNNGPARWTEISRCKDIQSLLNDDIFTKLHYGSYIILDNYDQTVLHFY